MEKHVAAIFIGLFAALVYPILTTLFGAIAAWAVGLAFEETIRATLDAFGMNPPVTMWQIGATLGFIGGYFKPVTGAK